jgi:hypothetical protein
MENSHRSMFPMAVLPRHPFVTPSAILTAWALSVLFHFKQRLMVLRACRDGGTRAIIVVSFILCML